MPYDFSKVETVNYVTTHCGVCRVRFALESGHFHSLKEDGDWFWCPNGHKIHYTTSENDRLKEQLKQKDRVIKSKSETIDIQRRENERERRSHAATKGKLTKTRKRVSKGICPCCNRSFVNLARHMTNKHPEYVGKTGPDGELP